MQLQRRYDPKPADVPFEQRPSCTIREACRATGLSRTTLYERMAAGELDGEAKRRLDQVKAMFDGVAIPHAPDGSLVEGKTS